jgi:hypothetical protein
LLNFPFIAFEPAASKNRRSGKMQSENHYMLVISHPSLDESYRTRFLCPWPDAVKLADQIRKMPFGKALTFLKAGVGK